MDKNRSNSNTGDSMKRLVSINIFLFLFSFKVLADLPNVVAFVNDEPITKYDFQARKQLVIALNNIDTSNPQIDHAINSGVLNLLIEENLLTHYTQASRSVITTETIDNVIINIEKHAMLSGGVRSYIEKNNLDLSSFRKQIEGELIKQNIFNSLFQHITTSTDEINAFLVNQRKYYDFDMEICIFTLKFAHTKLLDNESKLLKSYALKRSSIPKKFFNYIINDETRFCGKLLELPKKTRSIALDTPAGDLSMVYREKGVFKVLFINKKQLVISNDKLNQIKLLLSNEKTSAKINQFLRELKLSAYIKIACGM